jgi:uncharacterized protein
MDVPMHSSNDAVRRHLPLFLGIVLFFAGCQNHVPAPTESVVATDDASAAPLVPKSTDSSEPQNPMPSPPEPVSVGTEDAVAVDPCTEEFPPPVTVIREAGVPELTHRVTDLTGFLTPECIADLTTRMSALEQQTGAQIAILLVNTINGDDIESYANRAFHQWKLGRKGIDDGILVVVALKDKRARIEVGYGLEATIPDAAAGDILRKDLQPNFRDEHYNAGISAVVNDLAERVRATPLPATVAKKHNSGLTFFVAMLALSFLLGVLGAWLKLRWLFRILLPPVLVNLCVLVAVPLHLTPGYGTLIAMIPISIGVSFLGIPFVRSTRDSFQWLASWAGAATLLSLVTTLLGHAKGMAPHELKPWYIASIAGGFFFGTLAFVIVTSVRGGGIRSSSGSSRDRDSDSSSSSDSSSDSSSSSSSSDSDSGSFSGGGGDSGGGGASSSW